MSKFENAMKLMKENYDGKESVVALATISLTPNTAGKPRPANRMMCAYYEDGAFYMSSDAKKNKTLQIEKNNEVSICGMNWCTFQGTAENLGWVKDEKNAHIRTQFKKVFDWFDTDGDEDNPNSIILKITLTEGVMLDFEKKFGDMKYEIDFVNKVAK